MAIIDYPFGTYPRALIDSPISSDAKILYVTLSTFTTVHQRTCWPGKFKLRSKLNWSQHTLEKYIRELYETGWISREQRRNHGKFSGWVYVLHTGPTALTQDSDSTGGSSKPVRTPNTAARQNLGTETEPKIFQAKQEAKHTITRANVHCANLSDFESVCVKDLPKQEHTEYSGKILLQQSADYSCKNAYLAGKDSSKHFEPEEQETIDLTIERYQSTGTLHNLPGLLRYFATKGVDTTVLPQLRQWKLSQEQKNAEKAQVDRVGRLRAFQQHLLTCEKCRSGDEAEMCAEGRALRSVEGLQNLESMGCFGCEHCEVDTCLCESRMIRCQRRKVTVRDPLIHRCDRQE